MYTYFAFKDNSVADTSDCCLIYSKVCLLPSDDKEKNKAIIKKTKSKLKFYATNWCGRDTYERTKRLKGLEMTGKGIVLDQPLVYEDEDCDCGYTYPFRNEWNVLYEAESAVSFEDNDNQCCCFGVNDDGSVFFIAPNGTGGITKCTEATLHFEDVLPDATQ